MTLTHDGYELDVGDKVYQVCMVVNINGVDVFRPSVQEHIIVSIGRLGGKVICCRDWCGHSLYPMTLGSLFGNKRIAEREMEKRAELHKGT